MPLEEAAWLPLDHYPLAALIYRTIAAVDHEYAEFLHEQGYELPFFKEEQIDPTRRPKSFKLFVFSKPYLPNTLLNKGAANRVWFRRGPVSWQFSSPVPEFVQALVTGLLAQPFVTIGDREGALRYAIESVEEIAPPHFSGRMRFTTLSPLTLSVQEGGNPYKQFLRAEDPRFGPQLCENLCRKYCLLTGVMEAPREKLSFSFDQDYVSRRGGFGRVSRLEEYKGTKIKSWQAPFVMTGDPVLLQVGWECGFGEANSKGFGMVQAAPLPEL